MKVALLNKPKEILISERERPVPGENQVLIKVRYTGICGTDGKIFDGGIPSKTPVIMGHEAVGEIISGHTNNGGVPGDFVIIDPVLYCSNCFYCDRNETHLCENGALMGRDVDGLFSEYVVVPASNVFLLGDKINLKMAPLIQVMTTVLHSQNKANITSGEVVVVLGLGVTGLLQIQVAKALGAKVVIGVSRNPFKRELAENMGADFVVDHGIEAKKKALDVTGGRGADVVIESVGYLSVLAEAIDLSRIGGRIIPFGIYATMEGKLPFYEFYFKELNIINARAALPNEFTECIEMVEEDKVNLSSFITHTYKISELSQAILHLDNPSDKRLKVILEV